MYFAEFQLEACIDIFSMNSLRQTVPICSHNYFILMKLSTNCQDSSMTYKGPNFLFVEFLSYDVHSSFVVFF